MDIQNGSEQQQETLMLLPMGAAPDNSMEADLLNRKIQAIFECGTVKGQVRKNYLLVKLQDWDCREIADDRMDDVTRICADVLAAQGMVIAIHQNNGFTFMFGYGVNGDGQWEPIPTEKLREFGVPDRFDLRRELGDRMNYREVELSRAQELPETEEASAEADGQTGEPEAEMEEAAEPEEEPERLEELESEEELEPESEEEDIVWVKYEYKDP